MKRWQLYLAVLLSGAALLIILAGCSGQQAQQPAPKESGQPAAPEKAQADFPKKDITFIVPYTPGGGFDTYARLVAPYIQKYLPNKVNVVVQNVPGAETRLGLMQIYKADPDGYTIGIFNNPGQVTGQVVGNVDYDLNKITWLGRIADEVYVAGLSPKSPYKNLDDLKKAPTVKVGIGGGLSSTAGLGSILAAEVMGFKINPIAMEGSQESILAAIRGDIDYVQFALPTMRPFVIDSKQLQPLWVYTRERLPELPDTPTVAELGYPQLLDIVKIDYLLGATPGLPPEVRKTLADAFAKAMQDPELIQAAKNAKRPLSYASGEDTAGMVKRSLENMQKYRETLLKYTAK